MLKWFAACVEHRNMFIEVKGQNHPELEDPNKIELYFMIALII